MANRTRLDEVEAQKPGDYQKSQTVLDAEQAVKDYQAQRPGDYESSYQSRIESVLDKIENRKPFAYDFNADPLYQSYKNSYTKLGKDAAANASANAAALTGGYGNSYAATAAAQANQQYLNQLNNKIPELYQLAAERYDAEGDEMYRTLSALQQQDETMYGRWQDRYDNWAQYLSYLTSQADSAYQKDYGEYEDKYDAWKQWRDYLYGDYRDQIGDEQWQKNFEESQRQFDAQMALEQAQFDFEKQKYADTQAAAAAKAASRSGSSSSGSSGGGSKADYNRWYKGLNSDEKKTANKVFSSAENVEGYIANASGHGISAQDAYNYTKQAVNYGVISADELDRMMTKYYGRR